MEKDRQLTPNFKLSEFLCGKEPEILSEEIIRNLELLAQRLQALRDLCGGKSITITSGYRSPEHNAAVGGKKGSQHLLGKAADIKITGMSPAEVQNMLTHWQGGMGKYATFTHVDIRDAKARW